MKQGYDADQSSVFVRAWRLGQSKTFCVLMEGIEYSLDPEVKEEEDADSTE